eukprot:3729988-Alexandrium_andersonii.AAC.1
MARRKRLAQLAAPRLLNVLRSLLLWPSLAPSPAPSTLQQLANTWSTGALGLREAPTRQSGLTVTCGPSLRQ